MPQFSFPPPVLLTVRLCFYNSWHLWWLKKPSDLCTRKLGNTIRREKAANQNLCEIQQWSTDCLGGARAICRLGIRSFPCRKHSLNHWGKQTSKEKTDARSPRRSGWQLTTWWHFYFSMEPAFLNPLNPELCLSVNRTLAHERDPMYFASSTNRIYPKAYYTPFLFSPLSRAPFSSQQNPFLL